VPSLRCLAPALLFVFVGITPALAQFPLPLNQTDETARPAQVRELVANYCRLDYVGDRLNPQGWIKLQPLVWWKANPDFTQINVISRYTIDTEPNLSHGKYVVAVHYRLLGSYDLNAGYVSEAPNSVQDVNYTVSSANGEWRISDADNNLPHPSRGAMLKWLNEKISATPDAAKEQPYQDALRQLQTPPRPPLPH
jgi:hypothetical protein